MSQSSLPPPLKKLSHLSVEKLVRAACIASIISMMLMCWSVFDPTPFPVMVSMTVGQGIGTLALVCYLGAVVVTQLRRDRPSRAPARASSSSAPPKAE